MTKHWRNDIGTLLGYPIISAELSGAAMSYVEEQPISGGASNWRCAVSADPTLSIAILMTAEKMVCQPNAVDDLGTKITAGVYSIGKGRVCEHCGAYMTAGATLCPRCSAPTVMFPLVSPRNLPLHFESYEVASDRWLVEQIIILNVQFVAYGALPMSVSGGLGNLGAGVSLAAGYFVCQWCGGVSREGESCQHCSGTRLPLTEAVNIQRECVYCGAVVRGGIVCPRCSAAVSARTFAEATT